jgi:hypothetical protein
MVRFVNGSIIEEWFTRRPARTQANLHRNYVGLLERGQRMPSILVVQQLATALGTNMSELLAEVEQEQD